MTASRASSLERRVAILTMLATLFLAPRATTATPAQAAQDSPLAAAAAALQAGDHERAIELYRAAYSAQPGDLAARFGLGQALFFNGDLAEAVGHLEAVRDASGGAGVVQYTLGQAYLELQRFVDASRALDAAARERPDVVPLAFMRAELCYQLGRGAVAQQRLVAVRDLQAEWDLPHVRLGALMLDLGRPADAIPSLETALRLSPQNIDAALLLAGAYTNQERPEESVAVLEASRRAQPDSLPILMALSFTYDKLSRAEDLVAISRRVLDLAPGHPGAELRLAVQADLRGDVEIARAHARRAVAAYDRTPRVMAGVNPGEVWDVRSVEAPEAIRLLADLEQRVGDTEEARRLAERLVGEFPRFPGGHFLLGNMVLRGDDAAAGREHLARFKQLTDAKVQADLGANFLESDESVAEAEAAFVRALAEDDRDTAAWRSSQ